MVFTADMWCRVCKDITPHRVYFLGVVDFPQTPEQIWVSVYHICLGEWKDDWCWRYQWDCWRAEDYNALLLMGVEDYPCEHGVLYEGEEDQNGRSTNTSQEM